MKISLNTIRFVNQHYGSAGDPAPNGVDDLVEKIGAQLGAIEEVVDYGSKFDGVLVVKVMSVADHPNADRLHVCKVDDGGKAQNVERDENGYVQVVCGAPNVREGMLAAWLPPGSTVPSTIDKDPFVLEARPIRGEVSNGMMASPRELGIGESHEGILEVDKDVTPGTGFAEAYNLKGEVVIDIENKMFTHRPDCFGSLGVAREIAGVQGQVFKSPDWYSLESRVKSQESSGTLPLEVRNELPELVPRFTAVTMSDIEIKPSPIWLQILLSKLGLRPINNIVDYTNFFMLETGQPLHAYDYDKVVAQDSEADHATIVVRKPNAGEKILLLNGKEVEPRPETIMIATRDRAIGIGGVMGGDDTEVDENTKNIIIECASFDMYSIRRTSMAHGLFTDAVTRFTKGQSPLQNLAVLAKIVDEIRQFAGGKVASEVVDDNHLPKEMLERDSMHPPVVVSPGFINARLGLKLSADEIKTLLENVEFKVELRHPGLDPGSSKNDENSSDWIPNQVGNDAELIITAPFWRTDIEIPEDIVEEVGRLYGYDKLPLDLPKRDLTPAPKDQMLELKSKIRGTLSKAGANEVLTYSFVHGNLLDKVGQDKTQAFQIANALSPDLQYYRMSLVPSLLEKIHPNIKAGHDEFALFEIGKAHVQHEPDPYEPEVPKEVNALGFVFAAEDKVAKKQYAGAAYYQAQRYVSEFLDKLHAGIVERFESLAEADLYNNPWIEQMVAPFEPNRSAVLRDAEGLVWGVVGEFKASVRKSLKLPDFCAGFELDPLLFPQGIATSNYRALPRFPKVEQDICLKVPVEMPFNELASFVSKQAVDHKPNDSQVTLSTIDIYQREDDKDHKQITFRLSIASYDRTLTDAEVSKLLDHIAAAAKEKFGAERI